MSGPYTFEPAGTVDLIVDGQRRVVATCAAGNGAAAARLWQRSVNETARSRYTAAARAERALIGLPGFDDDPPCDANGDPFTVDTFPAQQTLPGTGTL